MTSSDKKSKKDSSQDLSNNSASDSANEKQLPVADDSREQRGAVDNAAAVDSSIDDNSIKEAQSANHNDDREHEEPTADAKPPETKVKMESVTPDVVVATLEPTDSEEPSESEGKAEASEELPSENSAPKNSASENSQSKDTETTQKSDQEQAYAEAFDSDDTHDNNDDAPVDSSADDQGGKQISSADQEAAAVAEQKEAPEESNKTHKDTQPANKKSSNDKDESTTESGTDTNSTDQDDKIKKEKEAKLESYKQFVAEQFSNKKVDYPEVRVRIEANALPSRMYFIMNILSAIIASYGLVTNSAAVVIGAMLVAMMLGPITGVALAIIDHRMPLLRKSLVTVVIGISLVLLVGFIVGWLHQGIPLSTEILSRTQPTSMDLMIALAGGTAGAYAMVSPHLSVAVVGVAVATAVVPPLAASGVLFAHGEIQLGLGALVLAITNIIAIQFTNALVLWVLGFRRLVKDDYQSNTYLTFLQRNAVTILLLGVLGTYLTINLQTNSKQQGFESSVTETISGYFTDKGNVVTNTQFNTSANNQVVRAVIRGETTPNSDDVRQIESIITQNMAQNFPDYLPIKIQLRYLPVQVIESNPSAQHTLDQADAAILTN